jgi:DNA-binding GntR family transcriptional regulator
MTAKNSQATAETEQELKDLPTWDDWTKEYRNRRREIMTRLYANGSGFSMTKIAEIYGVSRQRVQQIIRGEE